MINGIRVFLVLALLLCCSCRTYLPVSDPRVSCVHAAHDICRSAYELRYKFTEADRTACMDVWLRRYCGLVDLGVNHGQR